MGFTGTDWGAGQGLSGTEQYTTGGGPDTQLSLAQDAFDLRLLWLAGRADVAASMMSPAEEIS